MALTVDFFFFLKIKKINHDRDEFCNGLAGHQHLINIEGDLPDNWGPRVYC